MKLSSFLNALSTIDSLTFNTSNGEQVPSHFHVTEAGLTTKHFVDCGGVIRTEKNISFQLWVANDTEHRLSPRKLAGIINQSSALWNNEDLDIEIEYQGNTIGRYDVKFDNNQFALLNKQTDCLAKDHCGIPVEKLKVQLAELQASKESCCTPGGGCC